MMDLFVVQQIEEKWANTKTKNIEKTKKMI